LFDSGQVYLSATVAPHNRMVIDEISVEVPAGNPASVRVMPTLDPQPQSDSSLRAAAPKAFRIGAFMETGAYGGAFRDSPEHRATLAREFNSMTVYTSFSGQHPAPDRWDFCDLDIGVAYAQANQMTISAQTLLYDATAGALPDWLINGGLNTDQVRSAIRDYIRTVVGRYRGRIGRWNVENELLDQNGQTRDLFFSRTLGPGFLDDAFRWAREADSAAKLFYNEYSAGGLGAKSDGVFNLVKGLHDRGVPIDGVGLQMHVTINPTRKPFEYAPPPTADVAANMQRLAGLGLDVYITEMDVKVGEDATRAKLDEQAQVFASMLRVCLAAPNCGVFATWGVSDRYSWYRRPASACAFPGFSCTLPWEQPLLFDESFQPKPAYDAVLGVLAGR
jgi:endo-1,4-beta-xylanase